MNKSEAGRLGGLKTAATHDHDHYVALGKKGFGRLAQKFITVELWVTFCDQFGTSILQMGPFQSLRHRESSLEGITEHSVHSSDWIPISKRLAGGPWILPQDGTAPAVEFRVESQIR